MPVIQTDAVGAQQPGHARHQVGVRALDHQMTMVGHQAKGMNLEASLLGLERGFSIRPDRVQTQAAQNAARRKEHPADSGRDGRPSRLRKVLLSSRASSLAADVKSAQSNLHHFPFLRKVRPRFFDRLWLMMSRSDINRRTSPPGQGSRAEFLFFSKTSSHAVSPLGFKSDPSDLKGGPSDFLNIAPQHDVNITHPNTTRSGSGMRFDLNEMNRLFASLPLCNPRTFSPAEEEITPPERGFSIRLGLAASYAPRATQPATPSSPPGRIGNPRSTATTATLPHCHNRAGDKPSQPVYIESAIRMAKRNCSSPKGRHA
jgi:hypothetical protein